MKYCYKCGSPMEDDMLFCPKCGQRAVSVSERFDEITNHELSSADYSTPNLDDENNKGKKKWVIGCIAAVVILLVIVVVGMNGLFDDSDESPASNNTSNVSSQGNDQSDNIVQHQEKSSSESYLDQVQKDYENDIPNVKSVFIEYAEEKEGLSNVDVTDCNFHFGEDSGLYSCHYTVYFTCEVNGDDCSGEARVFARVQDPYYYTFHIEVFRDSDWTTIIEKYDKSYDKIIENYYKELVSQKLSTETAIYYVKTTPDTNTNGARIESAYLFDQNEKGDILIIAVPTSSGTILYHVERNGLVISLGDKSEYDREWAFNGDY